MANDSPNLSLSEHLTNLFYDWERHGRGWQLWPEPVDLEPAFRPFSGHYVPENSHDDGRRPTAFSHIFESFRSLIAAAPRVQTVPPEEKSEPKAAPEGNGIVEWHVILPSDSDTSCKVFEAFLLSISWCRFPISFEIVAANDAVRLILAGDEEDAAQVEAQVAAHFKEAILNRQENILERVWQDADSSESLVVDFGLSHEFMLPLAVHGGRQTDSFVSLIAALSNLRAGEVGIFQVLFKPVKQAWARSITRAVTFSDGSPVFDDAPEFMRQVKNKVSRPLYAVSIRIAVASGEEERVWQIAWSLTAALAQFANPEGNELIPLTNDGYDNTEHIEDVLARRSRRSGMVLNGEELASIVHLPASEVQNAKLVRVSKTTRVSDQCDNREMLPIQIPARRSEIDEDGISIFRIIERLDSSFISLPFVNGSLLTDRKFGAPCKGVVFQRV